jgi:ArsR family metal-binding transcriptional regulator
LVIESRDLCQQRIRRPANATVDILLAHYYIKGVMSSGKLITDYQFELVEDHHHPGSGNYSVRVVIPDDISGVFPYLNAVLDDPRYDYTNNVVIGSKNKIRYAFRPHEIHVAVLADRSNVSDISKEAVDLVNQTWKDRDHITPSLRERKLPPVYVIYKSLPQTANCKKCGYPTCLAFAAALRSGEARLEQCPLLLEPEYNKSKEQIITLFSAD